MKPAKVAESKTFRKRDSILHYGELIEGNKNAPSSVRNNYTFSFSLVPVTNLRVIVIVKPSQFWRSLPGEREREEESGYYERLVEWFPCSSRDFLPVSKQAPEYSVRLIYLYGGSISDRKPLD